MLTLLEELGSAEQTWVDLSAVVAVVGAPGDTYTRLYLRGACEPIAVKGEAKGWVQVVNGYQADARRKATAIARGWPADE